MNDWMQLAAVLWTALGIIASTPLLEHDRDAAKALGIVIGGPVIWGLACLMAIAAVVIWLGNWLASLFDLEHEKK